MCHTFRTCRAAPPRRTRARGLLFINILNKLDNVTIKFEDTLASSLFKNIYSHKNVSLCYECSINQNYPQLKLFQECPAMCVLQKYEDKHDI